MKAADSFRICPEYNGQTPNLKPAASAFARVLEKITGADGCFSDPALEAEFQEWIKQERRDDLAGCMEKREGRPA